MQVKIYVPTVVEIPNAYVPALARRASETIGDKAAKIPATRGHLVRQAVQDGLLRQFDDLVCEDGSVDLVCDPAAETPLELQNKTLSLGELIDALQSNREWSEADPKPKAA
jgi:hypothetical protein